MTINKPHRLYIFIGYPGSGKTTIAKIIADETGAKHIWADVERHKIFKNPSHSTDESHNLYKQLNEATNYLLSQNKSVVFDTNFNHYADRIKLKKIADKNKAQTVIIWVNTPKKVAKYRSVLAKISRNLYKMHMSEKQFEDIISKLEPPKKDELVIKIDGTDATKTHILRSLKGYL